MQPASSKTSPAARPRYFRLRLHAAVSPTFVWRPQVAPHPILTPWLTTSAIMNGPHGVPRRWRRPSGCGGGGG
eukprot:3626155-Pyramimonas_sp.AAC.1